MRYKTTGTCSAAIDFNIVDGKLTDVKFLGGCNGNTQGISKLVEGMNVEDVIARLEGIQCGTKNTSCPDQLAKALKQTL
ncbi:MAG: TIGR03905 family TSCPD domain-containing protein [Clostridium sp.]|nr:TIGR03905 family TSCPD domain-containing protein [Clostridium sp.]MCM1460779.1 TIGR03905 family TSCPD domain-containing protein [Bacteroides sp.]